VKVGESPPTERLPGSESRISSWDVAAARVQHSPVIYWAESVADLISRLGRVLLPRKQTTGPPRMLLYSGQFDPFHKTHLRELQGALDECGFERGIVAPMDGVPGLPYHHAAPWLRLLVAQSVVGDDSRIQVDHLGLRKGIGTAPELVRAYRDRYGSDASLVLLLGSDNFLQLRDWAGAESLLDNVNLLVNEIPGYEVENIRDSIPANAVARYREAGDKSLTNPESGRWIRMVKIEAGEISSRQVNESVQRGDRASVDKMLGPEAADLVMQHHYAQLPYARQTAERNLSKAISPKLCEYLGEELGTKLAGDSTFLARLREIDVDHEERTAQIADSVFEATRRLRVSLQKHPTLFSQAVKVAIDSDVLAEVKRLGAPTTPNEQTTSRLAEPRLAKNRRTNGYPWIGGLKKLFSKLTQIAIIRCNSEEDMALPVRPAPLNRPFSKETIRVYLGTRKADIEDVRARGVLSHVERRFGREEMDRRIQRDGEAATLLLSNFSRNDKDQVSFVSTTLSPSIAESFAGIGGHVIVADVPANAGWFLNDPQVWTGTPFRKVGNPEFYVQEFAMREIKPEWIHEIRPIIIARPSVVLHRHVQAARRTLRALLPLARALASRLLG